MSKPTTITEWATSAVYEYVVPESGTGTTLALNKVVPDISIRQGGISSEAILIRQHLNYTLHAHYERLLWLEEKEIGELWETSNTSLLVSDVEALFGNTWEDLGTETKYGVSFKGFRRTA